MGKSYSDIEADNSEVSVDVMHLIQRVKPIVSALMSTIPHSSKWFCGDDLSSKASTCVKKVLLNMVLSNEVAVMNNRRRMSIAPERNLVFGSNSIVLGAALWQTTDKIIVTTGFGRWIQNKSNSVLKLSDELAIPMTSTSEWFENLVRDAQWSNKLPEGDFKLFTPEQMRWHKDSWVICNPFNLPQGISLIKNNMGGYILAKKQGEIIKTVLLDQWYWKTKEICRIMYAIGIKTGKPSCFEATIYEDYALINIHSRIPKAEERLILLTSWPQKNILDPFTKVIPIFLWNDVKNLIENMGAQWIVKVV